MTNARSEPHVGLGTVGLRELALVDRGGGVSPAGSGWRVRFFVRSEERWHVPVDEASTRQEMSHGASGVITRVRIRGGDIVASVSTSLDPKGRPHARMHIANPTPLPIGVAIVLTAGDLAGASTVDSVAVVSSGIRLGYDQVVGFPRDPGALLAAADAASLHRMLFEEQSSTDAAAASSGRGEAAGAAVFPVAHGGSLTLSIALGEGDASPPDSLPDDDTVAKGWAAHLDRGARVVTGDDVVDSSLLGARQRLLIAAGDGIPGAWPGYDRPHHTQLRGALALALSHWGFATEAASMRDHLAAELDEGDATTAAAWLLASEAARSLGGATAPSAELVLLAVATIDEALRRPRRRPAGALGLAHVADAADPYDAVHSLWVVAGLEAAARSMASRRQPDAAARLSEGAAELRASISDLSESRARLASALGPWFDPETAHRSPAPVLRVDNPDPLETALALISFPRRFIVSHASGFDVVAPSFPGANWEIHDLSTPNGSVSIALRWHGSRVALLWEHQGASLSASSIDPRWADTKPAGETLLDPRTA
jgi:hypothetical protein